MDNGEAVLSFSEEVDFETVVAVHQRVGEFSPCDAAFFEKRCAGRETLVLVAWFGVQPAGYIVCYGEPDSCYCWMTGVDPAFRRRGVLNGMMSYSRNWARARGYRLFTIKTWNARREMLAFLVAQGFNFTAVEPMARIEENRIRLERPL